MQEDDSVNGWTEKGTVKWKAALLLQFIQQTDRTAPIPMSPCHSLQNDKLKQTE